MERKTLTVEEAISYVVKEGYDEKEALAVIYDDAKLLKKGKTEPFARYELASDADGKTIGEGILATLAEREKKDPNYLPPSIKKTASKKRQKIVSNVVTYTVLVIIAAFVFFPILMVLMNSFKDDVGITLSTFHFPNADTFVGIRNYSEGLVKAKFWNSFGISLYITVVSTVFILLFSSMTAWFITRVKTWWTKVIYYVILFSMVVPFQMVMLPLNQIASTLGLDNPWYGIIIIYIAFGAGLSVFMFSGFVKSVPLEIEESAMIDGCNPVQTFFHIVFPILKPTTITVAVLNVMWIWNDYLLPYMVLGNKIGETTIPVAVQMVSTGSYGAIDYGMMMAMIVLTMIPVVVFYLFGQKYIIRGVTAGAVKG